MMEDKFNQVYERYSKLVLKVAFNVVSDHALAQDICQDVFVRYYQKMDTIDEDMIKPWLLVVTQRRAIDYQRKQTIRNEVAACVQVLPTNMKAFEIDNVLNNACRRDNEVRMFKDLRKKNMDWYNIIMMVVVEGQTEAETARKLGLSQNVVRIKLHRARKWLKKEYADKFNN